MIVNVVVVVPVVMKYCRRRRQQVASQRQPGSKSRLLEHRNHLANRIVAEPQQPIQYVYPLILAISVRKEKPRRWFFKISSQLLPIPRLRSAAKRLSLSCFGPVHRLQILVPCRS
jgi:hypothetical protein